MFSNFDIRGIWPGAADAPLDLTGDWTGYNNGATMQVGLWIANDGEYIKAARRVAVQNGPVALAEHLTAIMARSARHTAPGAAWAAAIESDGGTASIDWAQIAYDLIGDEPDEDDLASAREDLGEAREEFGLGDDDTVFELAARRRRSMARDLALGVDR